MHNAKMSSVALSPTLCRVAAGLLGLLCANSALATALQCQVTYAGTTDRVMADPVSDPYPLPSVDIGGRFRLKPIVVGTAGQIERVLIYAYVVDPDQARLIHQAKYLPPFHSGALTGQHFLYAGPLERELSYACQWAGGQS
jgi:hypothetical protein